MREYVAQTLPMAEEIAVANLKSAGFEAFNPTLVVTRRIRGKPTQSLVPWFPLYIFVRMDLRRGDLDWRRAAGQRGVRGFLGTDPDHPTPLPIGAMDELLGFLKTQKTESARDLVRVKSKVRVTGGSFEGLIGTCIKSSAARVKVLLSLFGGAVSVDFPRSLVEAA